MGTDMYLNPPPSRCKECGKEIPTSNFLCYECYQQLKGEQTVTSFQQAFEQWKSQHESDNRLFNMKYYDPKEDQWKPYHSSHFGFNTAETAAQQESVARPERLVGVSYKGEMHALYSEGKCIWRKEE